MRSAFFILLVLLALPAMTARPPLLSEKHPMHLRSRLSPPHAPEVDLNGLWAGELLQNAGGIAERFEFSMQLIHNGIFLKGTAFVKHEDIWAEMEVSGFQLPNGSWKLTDVKVLRAQKPKELSWCEKSYELRVSYTPEGLVLHGPWWGDSEFGACIPGSVRLKRKIKTV